MTPPRIDSAVGLTAVRDWQRADPSTCPSATVATAVRYTLQVLAGRAPGGSLEVRVPPYGAIQCLAGPSHSRGTPPNVVQSDPEIWLRLATGQLVWQEALSTGLVTASGIRADLGPLLPLPLYSRSER